MKRSTTALLLMLAIGIAGCGKKAETPRPTSAPPPASTTPAAPPAAAAGVTLGSITIGNSVGPDKKVTNSVSTLARNDTIYASVDTTGSGTATLKAKWTYVQGGESTVVKEESLTIDSVGPATTEFHIDKPGGWPTGEYQVEIFVDDTPAGTRRFTVG